MSQLDINEILACLPHRYPFILIDRVLDYEVGQHLTGVKNVTANEPFFTGHFPENPIMPGVLILEALAQACIVFSHQTLAAGEGKTNMHYFVGIDKARFKQMVVPGDQLVLKVALAGRKRNIWRMHCEALVDDKIVCSADLMSAMQEVSK